MFESELIGQFSLDTQRTMPLGQAQVGILRLDNTVLNQRVDEVDRFTARPAQWPRCLPAPASNCCG